MIHFCCGFVVGMEKNDDDDQGRMFREKRKRKSQMNTTKEVLVEQKSADKSSVSMVPKPILPHEIPFDDIVAVTTEFVPAAVIHTLILPYVEQRNNCYMLSVGSGYTGDMEVYIWNTKAEVVECYLKMDPSDVLNLMSNSMCYLSLDFVKDSCLATPTRGDLWDLQQHIRYFEYDRNQQPPLHRELTIREVEHQLMSPKSFNEQSMICLSSEMDQLPAKLSPCGTRKLVFVIDVTGIPDLSGGNASRHFVPKKGEDEPNHPSDHPYEAIRILNFYDCCDPNDYDVSENDNEEQDPRVGHFYYGKNIFPSNL